MKLSKRLAAVAALVPQGAVIADVGTDHAYLPVWLCEAGTCPAVIATDVAVGPLESAERNAVQSEFAGKIDCRLADGLKGIRPGEADGAVICGMGGALMTDILAASPDVRESLEFLVLQPMSEAAEVRKYVVSAGYRIEAERIVKEGHKLYEIIKAVRGEERAVPEWQYETGPRNWEEKPPFLRDLIEEIIRKKKRLRDGLLKSRTGRSERTEMLAAEIEEWEGRKWQCLSKK